LPLVVSLYDIHIIVFSLRSVRNSNVSVKELLYILNDVFTQLNTIWSTAAVDYFGSIKLLSEESDHHCSVDWCAVTVRELLRHPCLA
jgi:hypothetical protein